MNKHTIKRLPDWTKLILLALRLHLAPWLLVKLDAATLQWLMKEWL
jgi:hypothetical protein